MWYLYRDDWIEPIGPNPSNQKGPGMGNHKGPSEKNCTFKTVPDVPHFTGSNRVLPQGTTNNITREVTLKYPIATPYNFKVTHL